jgi:uncharacterized surface protein with fasciclin (FAS1) repeats
MRRVFYVVVFIAFSSFHVGEAAESSSCQTLVFSGLSTSCNLNGGQSSSEDACCRALDTANAKRCFCDEGLMTTIKLVIGDNGIQFFRDFAIGSCSGELTEGEACVDGDGDDESEWDGVIAPPPPMDHTHRDLELSEIDYYTRDVRGSPPPARRPTPLFPTRAPPERETIANFILDPRRDAEIGFTADALTLTGVRNELDSNQTSHTVFVPTNEAWYALLFRLGVTKEELFADANWLADALRYHTVRGIAHTSNIGFGTSLLTDLDDEELHVEKYSDSRRSTAPQIRVNGCFVHPNVNRRDVRVGDDGVVHYIDCVLLPPRHPLPTSRTLAQYLSSEPSVSMFANALAGSSLMSALWNESRRYTVFAPTNDAFVRFLGDPRVGASFYDDVVFRDMLARHVALGFHEISELSTGRASKSLATVAGDDDRSRAYVETRRRGEVFVNGCAVIGEQVFARDGAVHFIDCVID